MLNELKEIKAKEVLSGKTEAGKTEEKPKEENAFDYAERILKGAI